MIKVGQFISSRLDVLPKEVTRELEALQDDVAPEAFELILREIEQGLGISAQDAFLEISPTPLASASLGQVHRASLHPEDSKSGISEQVVVKVLRPGIESIVDVDLQALRKIAGWMSKVKLVSKRADVPALVNEFAQTTFDEIDYFQEAKNLSRFARNFAGDELIGYPEIIWPRTSRRVLTLTDVSAIKITDVASLREAGIDPDQVAAEYARSIFQQIFVDGFFHADPHPGNIFVRRTTGETRNFQIVFIDFGMMGTISPRQQRDLQGFIIALAARDARGLSRAMQDLGLLLPSADTIQLESAIAAVFRKFGGVAVNDLVSTDPKEFFALAREFDELLRQLPFQVPQNFLLLGRSISIVSGVASSLNLKFNIWNAVDPFARSLLQTGFRSAPEMLGSLVKGVTSLLNLPGRIEETLGNLDRGELSVRNSLLERKVDRIQRAQARHTVLWLISVATLVAALTLR